MARFEAAFRRWSLALALALPLASSASVRADDPGAAPASAGKKPVRQAGSAQGPKPEAKKPGAASAPSAEVAAARKATVERLREQTERVREELRQKRQQLDEQAKQDREQGREDKRAELSEAKEQAREAKREDREALREARHPHARQGAPDNGAERARRMRKLLWQGMASRVDRPSEIPSGVRAELEEHASRLARLYRVRELAQQKGDQEALDRATTLVGRELARHRKQMVAQWQAQIQNRAAAAPAGDDERAQAEAEAEAEAELEEMDEGEEEGAER